MPGIINVMLSSRIDNVPITWMYFNEKGVLKIGDLANGKQITKDDANYWKVLKYIIDNDKLYICVPYDIKERTAGICSLNTVTTMFREKLTKNEGIEGIIKKFNNTSELGKALNKKDLIDQLNWVNNEVIKKAQDYKEEVSYEDVIDIVHR